MSVAEADLIPRQAPAEASQEGQSAPARSRAETRRRLVAAATELFAAEGLHGATSARIARRAGVAAGTFYLHFEDKKALFAEIAATALAELRARQLEASRGLADPRAELRARTAELLRFAEANRELVQVLFGRGGEAGGVGDEVLAALESELEERLAGRIAAGEVPAHVHPGAAARAIAGMTARVVTWWVEDPSRAPREQVIEILLHAHPLFNAPAEPVHRD